MTAAEIHPHGSEYSRPEGRPHGLQDAPMIIGRIRERFRDRLSEWFCAANMTWVGTALLHPSDTFGAPAYRSFRWIGEGGAGWAIGILGLFWLIGLIINGSRQKATSTIRMVCATVGAIAYGLLGIGFGISALQSTVMNIACGSYMLMSALALYALYWIAVDKRTNG